MAEGRDILKVGLVAVVDGRVLVVRKRGGRTFILPGGKPEGGETEVETLVREVREELGCEADPASLEPLGRFRAPAADLPGRTVTVVAHLGRLLGEPVASGEIDELRWFEPGRDDAGELATSISGQVIPALVARGLLTGG